MVELWTFLMSSSLGQDKLHSIFLLLFSWGLWHGLLKSCSAKTLRRVTSVVKAQYQTRSWVFSVCFLAWAGRRCRLLNNPCLYLCNNVHACFEDWLMGKYFVSEWAFMRRKRLWKWRQNLVTPSTTQRDIKKKVLCSAINKSYSLSTPGRGLKMPPLKVRCVVSWQPQGS